MPCSFPFMSCCWHGDFPQPQSRSTSVGKMGYCSQCELLWQKTCLEHPLVVITGIIGFNTIKGSLPHSTQSTRPWTHDNDRNTCCFQDISMPRPLALVLLLTKLLTHSGNISSQDLFSTFFLIGVNLKVKSEETLQAGFSKVPWNFWGKKKFSCAEFHKDKWNIIPQRWALKIIPHSD